MSLLPINVRIPRSYRMSDGVLFIRVMAEGTKKLIGFLVFSASFSLSDMIFYSASISSMSFLVIVFEATLAAFSN